MSVERHELFEGDVGAYLLGALEQVEERRFEDHLQECPVCEEEVERLRPAVQALPRSVWPMKPPDSLKASLMASVEVDVREREGRRRTRPLAWISERARRASAAVLDVGPRAAWVAASVILLLGIASGAAGLYALDGVTSSEEPRPPASRVIQAKVDKTRVPFGSGSLVVPALLEDGAVLRVHGLRPLEEGSVYQVWVRRKGEAISQSLFTVGEDGEGAAAVADDLEGADAVLVTREPAGGAKAPGEQAILRVPL